MRTPRPKEPRAPRFWPVRSGCSPTTCLAEPFDDRGANPSTLCGRGGPIGGPIRRHASAPSCERCMDEAKVRLLLHESAAELGLQELARS